MHNAGKKQSFTMSKQVLHVGYTVPYRVKLLCSNRHKRKSGIAVSKVMSTF